MENQFRCTVYIYIYYIHIYIYLCNYTYLYIIGIDIYTYKRRSLNLPEPLNISEPGDVSLGSVFFLRFEGVQDLTKHRVESVG